MGGETITFDEKNATQFIIKNRQPSTAVAHSVDDAVYKPVTVSGSGVTLLTMGVIYNLDPTDAQPYASVGCLLYTSPSPRDKRQSRMPSSA